MTTFDFIDGDLPVRDGRGDPLLWEFADALRSNPGKWAKFPRPQSESARITMQSKIRRGDSGAPRALREGFEAATVDKQLYVRFVGEGEKAE